MLPRTWMISALSGFGRSASVRLHDLPQARIGVVEDGQEGHGVAIGEISCESSGNYLL